jgi:hypothetical protein
MKAPPVCIKGGVAHQLRDTKETQHHRAIDHQQKSESFQRALPLP